MRLPLKTTRRDWRSCRRTKNS